MIPSVVSAPVTEVAYITLKEGKESQRGELERLIGELKQQISFAEGFHGFTWGQSVDPGDENVYMLVLGWDTAAAHWAAVGPETVCGKLLTTQVRPIAHVDLKHAALKN